MVTLKRVTVWLLERLIEACLLGALFAYLMVRTSGGFSNGLLSEIEFSALIVFLMLFSHGYYITTAILGVLRRGKRLWAYPAITVILFVVHTHIIFLHGKPDFTQEARAMELPMIVGGAFIVFACSFVGQMALASWAGTGRSSNAYLPAATLTLFAFLLLNIANYLRPVVGSLSFRPYGLPFRFYREGGFVDGWVWHSGVVLWGGLFADVAVVSAAIALAGKAAQRVRTEHQVGRYERRLFP
jgi:hypothetical protein